MSLSRGQYSAPGSVPRDYGLLQAPRTSLTHSQLEADNVRAELDEARQALERYAHSGSVCEPHFGPDRARNGRGGRTSSTTGSHVGPSRASSRASSLDVPGAQPIPMPGAHTRAPLRPRSIMAASPSGSSISRRYRDIVLGGEPIPPPIEQLQQQYLEQHYSLPGSDDHPHTNSHPHSNGSVRRRSASLQRSFVRPSLQRRWSHKSDVVPRRADVDQVRQQLRRSSAALSSNDVERVAGALGERSTLLDQSRPTSYAAIGSTDAPNKAPSIASVDSTTSTDELLATAPGPGAAREEAKTLAWYTIPILGTHLLELSLSEVTVVAIGHLGTRELAAASLASMTANVTGFSIISGFVSALDSLLPAAYSSPHPYSAGVWTQRMVILIALLNIPVAIIWYHTEAILIALHQDPDVAAMAASYLRVLTFALPAFGAFEIIRHYLQALGLFHAPTIAVGVASTFNVPAQILLVYGPENVRLGFIGAPIASVLSYYVMLAFGLFQCWIAPRDAWSGVTRKALDPKGLMDCWNLGFSSTIAMAAEWWAWEVANLMASALGTTALAAQSVLLVTCSLTYQLPMSVSVAAAVRIGNLLGAKQPAWAAVSTRTVMIAALVCGLLNSSAMVLLRNQWGWMFSSDPELIAMIATIMPYVGAFQIADGICGVGAGILRGSGRQSKGAVVNLVAYYVIGLPIGGVLMVYFSWGLQGIWLGLFIGLMVGAVGFLVLIFRTDWSSEAEKVLARMQEDMVEYEDEACAEEDALDEEIRSLDANGAERWSDRRC